MSIENKKQVNEAYWDKIADDYNELTTITTEDFHFGPLLAGDSFFKLLPEIKSGTSCLELGCGGAQNSIFLAKKGANCTAIDISKKQIEHANKLVKEHNVSVDLQVMGMEDINVLKDKFDFIHSSYALSFAENPENVIKDVYHLLNDGGCFIWSTGHPLFSGEWVDFDDETALCLTNYFEMSSDIRYNKSGEIEAESSFFQISKMCNWLIDAGFRLEKVLEPQILDLEKLGIEAAPYFNKAWLEYYNELRRIPGVIIFKCTK
jgi:2-polyprenyl-3-methyl-5-hydroxy-6-metoxy-1,4-benzoquinol methylase